MVHFQLYTSISNTKKRDEDQDEEEKEKREKEKDDQTSFMPLNEVERMTSLELSKNQSFVRIDCT
jgi:hypothetical protein